MPQLLHFSPTMPAEYPSRDLVVAFFFSVIIHVFLALLLWVVAIDRKAVEPVAPSIGTPLMVSLTTLPDTTHEELEIEEVTVIPATGPPAQHSQTDSRGTRSVERKPEVEIITPRAPAIPASGAHGGYAFTNDITLSFDRESPYGMEWNFGNIPEFKAEGIETSKSQGVQGLDAPGGNSLVPYLKPSYGLDSVNRFEQVFGKMSESEFQNKKLKWSINYIKKYEASMPPDCSTYYANKVFKGLFTIPFLIKDAVTDSDNACIW